MLKLFFIFLKIGAFTFGGGYAMIPLIEKELIDNEQILKKEEFLDYISIAQSFPGAIAINLSLLIGYKLYKLKGSLLLAFAVLFPSFISIIFISLLYNTDTLGDYIKDFLFGVRPVVCALLLYSSFNLFKRIEKKKVNYLYFLSAFVLVFFFKLNPIILLLLGGISSLWIAF